MGQVTTFFLGLSLFFAAPGYAQNTKEAGYSEYRRITPTIYYLPILNLDENYFCKRNDRKITIYGEGKKPGEKKPITNMCRLDRRNCMMQGSCIIILNSERKILHYYDRQEDKTPIFRLKDLGECPYGRGPSNVCLEPFYTLAADPDHHKSGDVVYIPALKGLSLPNGRIHDGFMVIRDIGGDIKGRDRFDFYTGFHHHESEANPFVGLRLADKTTNLPYTKVIDEKIKRRILSRRSYPRIPQ